MSCATEDLGRVAIIAARGLSISDNSFEALQAFHELDVLLCGHFPLFARHSVEFRRLSSV